MSTNLPSGVNFKRLDDRVDTLMLWTTDFLATSLIETVPSCEFAAQASFPSGETSKLKPTAESAHRLAAVVGGRQRPWKIAQIEGFKPIGVSGGSRRYTPIILRSDNTTAKKAVCWAQIAAWAAIAAVVVGVADLVAHLLKP
jgi:hypothetical protein